MNIFVLDLDPLRCAEFHCDKHLVKMITEHNQILGSVSHALRGVSRRTDITPEYCRKNFGGFPRSDESGDPHPYGVGYRNHPCVQWASRTLENYNWLCDLNLEMCKEYTRRYSRKHVGEEITRWYSTNPPSLPMNGLTPFALAMPASCKDVNDPVRSYRLYYAAYKSYFVKWKNGTPWWWKNSVDEAKNLGIISERCLPFV